MVQIVEFFAGGGVGKLFMAKRSIVLCGLVVLAVLSAEVSAAGRWYAVEVIVFRHALATTQVDNEQWPELESVPDYRGAQEIIVDLGDFDDPSERDRPNEVRIPGPRAFQALSRGELKMTGVFRTLRNSSAYEPILHVGWRQPGLGESRARSVYVSDRPANQRVNGDVETRELVPAPVTRPRLEGTIRVRTGRLLYVTADFVNYGAQAPTRILEQRKVRLKELHYFDHPLFGVIVRVTPYRFALPQQVDGAQ